MPDLQRLPIRDQAVAGSSLAPVKYIILFFYFFSRQKSQDFIISLLMLLISNTKVIMSSLFLQSDNFGHGEHIFVSTLGAVSNFEDASDL